MYKLIFVVKRKYKNDKKYVIIDKENKATINKINQTKNRRSPDNYS